jgi:hypothetical protein
MKSAFYTSLAFVTLLTPFVSGAAPVTTPTTFSGLVAFFLGLINQVIPLIFGIAFLFIMWKLIDAWILHPDDGSKREEGKTIIITGVIVMVIMLSGWGILNLMINSL